MSSVDAVTLEKRKAFTSIDRYVVTSTAERGHGSALHGARSHTLWRSLPRLRSAPGEPRGNLFPHLSSAERRARPRGDASPPRRARPGREPRDVCVRTFCSSCTCGRPEPTDLERRGLQSTVRSATARGGQQSTDRREAQAERTTRIRGHRPPFKALRYNKEG